MLEKDCSEERTLFCFSRVMANAINILKTHLFMGLSVPLAVPLAVLLGYFVAEPMELGLSVALNGAGAASAPAEQPAAGVAFNTEYIKA